MPTCDSCGEPATHTRDNCDICPTDLGPEYRWYSEQLCDDCDPETATEKARDEWDEFFRCQYLGIMANYRRAG